MYIQGAAAGWLLFHCSLLPDPHIITSTNYYYRTRSRQPRPSTLPGICSLPTQNTANYSRCHTSIHCIHIRELLSTSCFFPGDRSFVFLIWQSEAIKLAAERNWFPLAWHLIRPLHALLLPTPNRFCCRLIVKEPGGHNDH